MNSTKELIINHYKQYPSLQIQDLFKFIYQSSFGCEHLVSSLERATNYIKEEYSSMDKSKTYDIEMLDGNYSRVPLSYIDKGLSIETFAKLFYLSSKKEENGFILLENKLNTLLELAKDSLLPFSVDEIKLQINKWKENGFHAIHHSNEFRNSYHPSYRLISNDFIEFLPLFIEIDKKASCKNIIVAIEGGSASGKTTLSSLIEKVYDCNIIHMDDFFLQPHQRTKERLEEIGGNIDKERFLQEVLIPLNNDEDVKYRKFDCSTMSLGEDVNLDKKKITIIEGVYSMHKEFEKYYDFSVYLDISPSLQKERILKRNTKIFANRFFNEWIPLENKYFEKTNITSRCDIIIKINK